MSVKTLAADPKYLDIMSMGAVKLRGSFIIAGARDVRWLSTASDAWLSSCMSTPRPQNDGRNDMPAKLTALSLLMCCVDVGRYVARNTVLLIARS
jgi:hypothetical protein